MKFAGNRIKKSCYAAIWSAVLIGLSFAQAPGPAPAPTFNLTYEQDTARPGQDFRSFHPSPSAARLCQFACIADAQCRAWEYDPSNSTETCRLKNQVPAAVKAAGHVAGVVQPGGATASAPLTPQIFEMTIRSSTPQTIRCIDVPKAQFAQGVQLQMSDCNNSDSQLFSYDLTSHHLMIGSLCAQVSAGADQGGAVVLGPCGGQASASWNVILAGNWVQFRSFNNLCLDVAGGTANNGTPLQIWSCNGTPAQLWGLRHARALGTIEENTDRPGNPGRPDGRSFDLADPDYKHCQSGCLADANCRAWTYVRPGVQGPQAQCRLKTEVPPPAQADCCISGVVRQ